jgi:hypothetical protein
MDDRDMQHTRDRWSGPERWQIAIGVLGLLVSVAACVGQYFLR